MPRNKSVEPNSTTFTTESGLLLKLRRPRTFDVLSIDRQFVAGKPAVPTRKVETAFGVEDAPIGPPPDGKIDLEWSAYQERAALYELEYGQQIMDFYLLEYVEVDVPSQLPEIERTYQRMERAGKKPSYDLADDDGRKLAYIRRNLTDEESARLQLALRRMMRPTREAVEIVEAAFPGDVPGTAADG